MNHFEIARCHVLHNLSSCNPPIFACFKRRRRCSDRERAASYLGLGTVILPKNARTGVGSTKPEST